MGRLRGAWPLPTLTAVPPGAAGGPALCKIRFQNRRWPRREAGHTLTHTCDALGRLVSQAGPQGTVVYAYDLAGRRAQLTHPGGGLYLNYDYLVTGEVTRIRENGATAGAVTRRSRSPILPKGSGT